MFLEIIFAVFLLILVWGIVIYNLLVRDKNRVMQAWSDIDVQLKRRYDLIPKLVDAVNAYAHYEKQLLSEVTAMRSKAQSAASPEVQTAAERDLSGGLQRMLIIAEAYPELKADRQYIDLLHQITEVEQQIQYARRYYNGCVKNLNVRIDSFPDTLVARSFRYRHAEFFDFEPAISRD